MLGRLLPRDDQFFELFDQLAAHLATTAQMLDTLFGDTAARATSTSGRSRTSSTRPTC